MTTRLRMEGATVYALLVEDNPQDIDITLETLERSNVRVNLDVVRDGLQTLAYLRKEAPFPDAVRPDLILLDLNMPKMSGGELMKILKSDDNFKSIPVLVLTTSDSDKDILSAYDVHAACYLKKPSGVAEFKELIQKLDQFWFKLVQYPPREK